MYISNVFVFKKKATLHYETRRSQGLIVNDLSIAIILQANKLKQMDGKVEFVLFLTHDPIAYN